MRDIITKVQEQRERDRIRHENLDRDECMLCDAYGADKRSLSINCFYAVNEVVPEAIDLAAVKDKPGVHQGFYLLICKSCRAQLLAHLGEWRQECVALRGRKKNHDGYLEDEESEWGCDIPIRRTEQFGG